VQGAFFKNFAKVFRFSAKIRHQTKEGDEISLQSTRVWRDSTGFQT
jgi:hypothetical protein